MYPRASFLAMALSVSLCCSMAHAQTESPVASTEAEAPSESPAPSVRQYNQQHPLPTSTNIPPGLPSIPSAPHPSATQSASNVQPQR